MNCPNCGGLLDLQSRRCEYCDTTFTEKELGLDNSKAVKAGNNAKTECEKTLTEKKIDELKKEDENRPKPDNSDVLTSANVMSIMGFFPRVRMFFRDLNRTFCLILLIALEACFAFLMISGKITQLLDGELEGFIAVNIVILLNALLAGLISRIGYIRAGTAIVAVINFLAVTWTFVYPLIKTDFATQTPQSDAILAVVEMAVLALSVVLSHLVYRRH